VECCQCENVASSNSNLIPILTTDHQIKQFKQFKQSNNALTPATSIRTTDHQIKQFKQSNNALTPAIHQIKQSNNSNNQTIKQCPNSCNPHPNHEPPNQTIQPLTHLEPQYRRFVVFESICCFKLEPHDIEVSARKPTAEFPDAHHCRYQYIRIAVAGKPP